MAGIEFDSSISLPLTLLEVVMKEIENRILRLLEALEKQVYLHSVPLAQCQMLRNRTSSLIDASASDSWQTFDRTERWGGVDQVVWFRFAFTIPEQFADSPVLFSITTGREGEWYPGGPQYLVYVNGTLRHGLDLWHEMVRLCDQGCPGDVYQVYLHAFSGVKEILTGMQLDCFVEQPLVRCLYYDLKTAFDGAVLLPKTDKSRYTALQLLNRAVSLIDFRIPQSAAFLESVLAARDFARQQLYGSRWQDSGYTAYCVGHTHLDVAWLWTVEDTRRKAVRTFANAVDLTARYPHYYFVATQPAVYQFVEQESPQLFTQVQEQVARGRIEPEGAMWIEPDCNIPSGESFVRQLIMGKAYIQKKFGRNSHILWLPDTFGFSAALPQILKKAGVDFFATTKLSWNEVNHFPYDVFRWKGIDGSEILSYFTNQHAANLGVQPLREVWEQQQGKELSSQVLIPFGWGDAGGGATEAMLEAGERLLEGVPGSPLVKMAPMGDFVSDLTEETRGNPRLPLWWGELYLELHRGTLTSMAQAKWYNRKSECLYHDAETLAVIAGAQSGMDYPTEALAEGWQLIALNQFHDILPGSSVEAVYQTTFTEYEHVLALGRDIVAQSIHAVAAQVGLIEPAVLVFNTLGFAVGGEVHLSPQQTAGLTGLVSATNGSVLSIQPTADGGSVFFVPEVPAKGYTAFYSHVGSLATTCTSQINLKPDGNLKIETPYYSALMDSTGALLSLYHKKLHREVLQPDKRGNLLQVFEDMPYYYNDAWDIAPYFEEKQWEVCEDAICRIVENGPVRTVVRIEKSFSRSSFVQDILFYRDSPRIDFETTVNWRERFMLLKVLFPVQVHAETASYDIQFGNIRRPTHRNTSWERARFEVCGHKWADLSQDDFGVSLLNDCKYGYDVQNSCLRLTLLKSSEYPNPNADRQKHRFTYALYPHAGSVTASDTIKQGYCLNFPLRSTTQSAQSGPLPEHWSMLSVNQPSIIVETVKKAEQSKSLVVRLYESCCRSGEATLKTELPVLAVWECDLLENRQKQLALQGGEVTFSFTPYEIKTFEIVTE